MKPLLVAFVPGKLQEKARNAKATSPQLSEGAEAPRCQDMPTQPSSCVKWNGLKEEVDERMGQQTAAPSPAKGQQGAVAPQGAAL